MSSVCAARRARNLLSLSRRAVTAGHDKEVNLWDAKTGQLLLQMLGHKTSVVLIPPERASRGVAILLVHPVGYKTSVHNMSSVGVRHLSSRLTNKASVAEKTTMNGSQNVNSLPLFRDGPAAPANARGQNLGASPVLTPHPTGIPRS